MSSLLDRAKVRNHLENFDLRSLFIEELGWDHGGEDLDIEVAGGSYALQAVAHKRGMVAYQFVATLDDGFPDYPTRQKIEKKVAKAVREHIIIYAPKDRATQYWQWVKREPGQRDRTRYHIYHREQAGEALVQKLEHLATTLAEEEDLTLVDVSGRVRAAFDVEKVTKRFYERYRAEHETFRGFIDGIKDLADGEWYAAFMLNRMMFIYFIQKRGFLDGDLDYLRSRLRLVREENAPDQFVHFYRLFLLRLFHEGLGQPEADRAPGLAKLLGKVPYLNGGLFDVHQLERDYADIQIPDEAFERLFDFLDDYQWHLDDRPLHNDKEINPDVLGYIFEKYVNQKQMGAYYTKEDITGYISRNTIVPFLFDQAKKECPIAFKPGGGVWRLLQDDPDRYFYEAVRHGITYDINRGSNGETIEKQQLPPAIAAGIDDVSKRGGWNAAAPLEYALPTETWREHVARRERYEEIRAKLAAGEVTSISDLITYNLDIEKFAQDVIARSEGPELVRAFWKAVRKVSVLDPTCGSGAFLFAALKILEPLYVVCLEVMRELLDDMERSGRKHHPEELRDFHEALDELHAHPNEPYFVLKSIVIGNLYGVDIMEEAVEICKLRLFLKLVAQLESYDRIEPLPDIDFNIRAGNTLVGFASLEGVKRALGTDMVKQLALPDIEDRAELADRAFHRFREMQTGRGMDAAAFATAKTELRERLDELRAELDSYLADEYGIKTDEQGAYERWREGYQPFHWFVEFFGIMGGGGFDVIIGNPPYLETREVSYAPRGFDTADDGAIHIMCVEQGLELINPRGSISMIVPLALVASQRMKLAQCMLEKNRNCWYSNYSWRPGKLFDTVNRALTIFVATRREKYVSTFSTGYLKWNSGTRGFLISAISYTRCPRHRPSFWVPKIGYTIELSILNKCLDVGTTFERFVTKSGHRVYHRTDGGLYWKVFTDFQPTFEVNGISAQSSTGTNFSLMDKEHVVSAIAILSSDVFWWWYTVTSNLRHLNPAIWKNFPVPAAAMDDPKISKFGSSYVADLKKNSTLLIRNQKTTGRTETQSFKIRKSKPIIDQIDEALATHYDFDEQELDFLVNYDIKYRMSGD